MLLDQSSTTSDIDKQLSFEKQLRPVTFLIKLVIIDFEHRIIPPVVATHILTLVERATAPAAV